MLDWIAFASLCGGLLMLTALSAVDLKTRLLPNEMVLGFATIGLIFHLTTMARFLSPQDVILGGVVGFSTMYLVRAAANKFYGTDALGLGDVKLIGAGGLWLGPDGIMLAMSAGAFAGLVHGLCVALRTARKTKQKPDFLSLQIPAGPGFAIGIILIAVYEFWSFNPL